MGDRTERRCRRVASVVAAVLFAAGVALGAGSFSHGAESGGPTYALDGSWWDQLLEIVGRNLAAGLFLFSGFATMGLTTVVALLFTASWVGAGSSAIAGAHGWDAVSPAVLWYLPLELAGILTVSTAGLLPLGHLASRYAGHPCTETGTGVLHHLTAHAPTALRLAALGGLLILLGAVLEVAVIHAR